MRVDRNILKDSSRNQGKFLGTGKKILEIQGTQM